MVSMIRGGSAFLFSVLLATAEGAGNPGDLISLQQLSRHGARSPKSKYASECPSDPFMYQWDSWNAELSGPGVLEEVAIANVTRHMYGAWLGPYNGSQMTVHSEDSPRVLQSAEVVMSFLFPEGNGPAQGLPSRPTFVPIHTMPESEDVVLTAPSEACWARQKADYDAWWEATGASILEAGQSAVAPLEEFCGRALRSNGVFKDVVDGVGFSVTQGFAVNGGLDAAQLFAAQNLSIVLQRGQFATDEARTYNAQELPATLVANMDEAIRLEGSSQAQRYVGYFSHRHAHYALAEFFGWSWKQYGLPEGIAQTGSTVWIELRHGARAGQYDVALKQWIPHCGKLDMSACPAQPISLPGCTGQGGTVCSIEEFRAIVSQRVARTGSWQTLCGVELAV